MFNLSLFYKWTHGYFHRSQQIWWMLWGLLTIIVALRWEKWAKMTPIRRGQTQMVWSFFQEHPSTFSMWSIWAPTVNERADLVIPSMEYGKYRFQVQIKKCLKTALDQMAPSSVALSKDLFSFYHLINAVKPYVSRNGWCCITSMENQAEESWWI